MNTLAKRRLISLVVFFGGIALLIGCEIAYDTWAAVRWGGPATISDAMHDVPPMVVFAFGNLTGAVVWGLAFHFWWGAK